VANKSPADSLTTPDLVVLSLLRERPMHGYELNLELERRDVRDWAGISRPQVYYSLKKLERLGQVRASADSAESIGPERRVFRCTARGIHALADALEDSHWAVQRPPPPFLTWLALSWQARPGVAAGMISQREQFLHEEIARERATLRAIQAEPGGPHTEAELMVDLTIRQFELELIWLADVRARLASGARS
jgi:DNA-binding PadR family transcriptional regulator